MQKNSILGLILIFLADFIPKIAVFFLTVLLARNIDAAELGGLVICQTLVGFLGLFCNFGLNATSITDQQKYGLKIVLFLNFFQKTAIFILLLPLVLLISYLVTLESHILFILSLAMLLEAYNPIWYYQVTKKFHQYFLSRTSVIFSIIYVLVFGISSVLEFAYLILLANLLNLLIFFYFAKPIFLRGMIQELYSKLNIRRNVTIVATQLMSLIYISSDKFIIYVLTTPVDVATYEVAYKLTNFAIIFNSGYWTLKASSVVLGGPKQLNLHIAEKLFISIICFILLFTFAESFVHYSFGEKYSEAVGIMRVLTIAVSFIIVSSAVIFPMISKDMQDLVFKWTCFCALVNVILNIFTVEHFGPIAAAWSTVFVELIILIVAISNIKTLRKV